MTDKTRNIVIVASLIGLGLIAGISTLIAWRKRKSLENKIKKNNIDVTEASKATDSQVEFPLKKGMGYSNTAENNAVKVVQRYLNKKIAENSYIGYSILDEDGKFGAKTEEALYKISGVLTVGWSLYQAMLKELTPTYIKPITNSNTNPFDYTMGLFD